MVRILPPQGPRGVGGVHGAALVVHRGGLRDKDSPAGCRELGDTSPPTIRVSTFLKAAGQTIGTQSRHFFVAIKVPKSSSSVVDWIFTGAVCTELSMVTQEIPDRHRLAPQISEPNANIIFGVTQRATLFVSYSVEREPWFLGAPSTLTVLFVHSLRPRSTSRSAMFPRVRRAQFMETGALQRDGVEALSYQLPCFKTSPVSVARSCHLRSPPLGVWDHD